MKHLVFLTLIPCTLLGGFLSDHAIAAENPIIITQNTPPRLNSQPVSEAQLLYEKGQYEAAIQALERIIQQEQAANDRLGEAIALRNLALIYGKMGELSQGQQTLEQSLTLTQQQPQTNAQQHLLAQIHEVQGQLHLSAGKEEEALTSWDKASSIYQQQADTMGLTRARIGQTQALQAMGMHETANERLETLQQELQEKPDTPLKAKALQMLGDVQRAMGNTKEAETTLETSLKIAETLNDPEQIASIQISLGNTVRFGTERATEDEEDQSIASMQKKALDYYQKAEATSNLLQVKSQAKLNQLSIFAEQNDREAMQRLLPTLQTQLEQLPSNRGTIFAKLNLAKTLMKQEESLFSQGQIAELLVSTLDQAKTIEDQNAQAQIWISLGELYQKNQRYSDAQTATEKGVLLAQALNAAEISYQGQWQLGQILKQQQKRESAIAAYGKAVATLQTLRSDLVAINPDLQFSFRENVEPVYREYVDILLQPKDPSQEHLQEARKAIEALQLAELDNFFRDACSNVQEQNIDELDPESAIFYTIILEDRLEVIVALPGQNQSLRKYTATVSKSEIEQEIKTVRAHTAGDKRNLWFKEGRTAAQKLHDWLIQETEQDLQNQGVQNLVFVLDGKLRNISLAALYDGEEYLIEKYSIALAPSLNLINPQPLEREEIQILGGALINADKSVFGGGNLPNVETEIEQIITQVPEAIILKDQSFLKEAFKTIVNENPVSVVHLATHGKFSAELDNTYIQTWDARLNISELNQLLRADSQQLNPIELLILSACETARGDDRAALGLAGIAIRAGARSTVASLWIANDAATSKLMGYFYEALQNPENTKAEALREAQLKILQGEDKNSRKPYYWSGFVLVGNWL